MLLAAGLGVRAFGVFAAVSGVAVILSELGELGLQQTASRALVAGTYSLRAMVRARVALSALLLAVAALAPVVARSDWSDVLAPLILFFGLSGWSEFLGVALRARGHRVAEALVLLALRACTLATVAVAVTRHLSLAGGGLGARAGVAAAAGGGHAAGGAHAAAGRRRWCRGRRPVGARRPARLAAPGHQRRAGPGRAAHRAAGDLLGPRVLGGGRCSAPPSRSWNR